MLELELQQTNNVSTLCLKKRPTFGLL